MHENRSRSVLAVLLPSAKKVLLDESNKISEHELELIKLCLVTEQGINYFHPIQLLRQFEF